MARELKRKEKRYANLMMNMFDEQRRNILREYKLLEASVWENIVETALSIFPSKETIITSIESLINSTLLLGRETEQFQLSLFGIDFNLLNPEASQYLLNYGSSLISEVSETTKEEVTKITLAGLTEGLSWSKIASNIHFAFRGFSARRAKLIAVTEVGNAFQEGNLTLAKQSGGDVEKSWLTVEDDRVSELCRINQNAGWIPINEEFPSGHQRPLRFPGCRCVARYRLV